MACRVLTLAEFGASVAPVFHTENRTRDGRWEFGSSSHTFETDGKCRYFEAALRRS